MPKNQSLIDEKTKNFSVKNEFPKNFNTEDAKPKGILNDPNIERYETFTNVLGSGMYVGPPSYTYPTTGTVTGTQPIGGYF